MHHYLLMGTLTASRMTEVVELVGQSSWLSATSQDKGLSRQTEQTPLGTVEPVLVAALNFTISNGSISQHTR